MRTEQQEQTEMDTHLLVESDRVGIGPAPRTPAEVLPALSFWQVASSRIQFHKEEFQSIWPSFCLF